MKAVGARLPRYDGLGHVTGQTVFVDDVRAPDGNLWAKAYRSPHHSASIRKLDTRKAAEIPGVRGVIAHSDVPRNVYGHLEALGIPADEPLLAVDEVRYRGQPIAVVAAESEDAAQEAVDAIEVDFEERDPLFDIREAFDPDAPKIHPWGNWYPFFGGPTRARTIARSARATSTPPSSRPTRSSRASTGLLPSSTAPPRRRYALPCRRLRGASSSTPARRPCTSRWVSSRRTSSCRSTSSSSSAGPSAAASAARSTRHRDDLLAAGAQDRAAVKWRWTREEEFLCSSTRAPWHVELADAVTKDGWILGRKTLTLHDSGAYARFSPYGLTKHAFHHAGAYTIPNIHFDGYVVFTNRVPTTAMRGFGVTSVSFAVETHMNRIADVLGMDPYELRLRNANRIGDTRRTGSCSRIPPPCPSSRRSPRRQASSSARNTRR